MSPKGTPLTDAQYAAIAWAESSEVTILLSQWLGVSDESVQATRQRITRAWGWWCALVVRICPACDKSLLAAAQQSGANQRRRHPDCQHTLAVMRETSQRDLTHSGPDAFRGHVLWTDEEDARLRVTRQVPAPEIAKELGRSRASLSMWSSRWGPQAP